MAPIKHMTLQQLEKYTGANNRKILVSIRGKVYDVTSARDLYGPGKAYSLFAGKELARALATLDLSGYGLSDDLEGLSENELRTLEEWEAKFESQYPFVAKIGSRNKRPVRKILFATMGVLATWALKRMH